MDLFVEESFRILKPGGALLITSHLDKHAHEDADPDRKGDFLKSLPEMIARSLYYRRHRIGSDDHTIHIHEISTVEEAIKRAGFEISQSETFKDNFLVVGHK